MTYTVTLTHCRGVADASKRQAERAFAIALEHALGGVGGVVQAHHAYKQCLAQYGGEPLPLEAPAIDRDAVARWNEAVGAGREAAFVGWVRAPDSAHFEIQA